MKITGRCLCGQIRFIMRRLPLIVHVCHCTWCRRETGAAFAVNALVETVQLEHTGGPGWLMLPTSSRAGQKLAMCRNCGTRLWSHYLKSGTELAFVRVGALDEPGHVEPSIHIYTESKLPWVVIPEGARRVPAFYSAVAEWPVTSLARLKMATLGHGELQ